MLNVTAPPNWKYPNVAGGLGANTCDFNAQINPPRSMHGGGVNVVLADGGVVFVNDNIDVKTFQMLGHRSDGGAVDANSY